MGTELPCCKGMTTRELAKVIGVDSRTIQRTASKLFDPATLMSRVVNGGKSLVFNEAQATAIKCELQNHSKVNALTPKTRLEKQLIIQQAMRLQEEMIAELQAENQQIAAERDSLLLELDSAKEWASVKRMEALNEGAFSWRALKRYSLENGYGIKKVFDQNYGNVNAYHKDVWEAVYGEQIDNAPWH